VGYGPWNAGTRTGIYRLGDDALIKTPGAAPEGFDSIVSGADFADAFANEIEDPTHHRAVFTVGY
jgi:putative NADH-flavin reductase